MVTGRLRNLLVLAAALSAGLAGVGFASVGFTGAGFSGAEFSSIECSSTGPSAPDPLAGLAGRSEGVIVGEVMARSVRAFPAPDGGELFFTTLRVSGTDLATSSPVTIEVIFAGGFISETRGSHSSTAPPADRTRVGRRVVAFHRHVSDIAEGFAGEVLVDGGAGLFPWFESRKGGAIVQGRRGAALPHNVRLADLRRRFEAARGQDGGGR